jgi:hypothetical protein
MSVQKAARVPILVYGLVTSQAGEASTLSPCHRIGYSCIVYLGQPWTECLLPEDLL